MRWKLSAAALVAIVSMGIAASSASAAGAFPTNPTISPANPYVDDDVTVIWKATQNLPTDERYQAILTDEDLTDCASLEIHTAVGRPKKGQIGRITLSPYDAALDSGPQWCDGKAGILLEIVKPGTKSGHIIGTVDFRFRRQP